MRRSTGRMALLGLLTLTLSLLAACGQASTGGTTAAPTSAVAAPTTAAMAPTTGAMQPTSAAMAPTSAATTEAPMAATSAATAQATAATGGATQTNIGTEANPIKMYFVPSGEAAKILEDGDKVATALTKATGYQFKTAVPTSYAAVIEAMGSDEADIAWLASFAYVLAHDKYGAEVALTTLRNGEDTYKGEIIARADSGIKTIEGCNGKTVAWVDPASASGYIYPSGLFIQKGIKPSSESFAGGHPQAVLAVYEGNADCAASYYSPDKDGVPQDGRATALKAHPDAATALSIIGYTDPIPNDTVTFRKDFPADARDKVVTALMDYASTDEGKQVLTELYAITGFVKSEDSRYNIVRDTVKALGKDPSDFVK